MLVMRRANGDLFTEVVDGRIRIPVWSDSDAVERFKARNPELMIFLAVPLTRSIVQKSRQKLDNNNIEFFLLSDTAPSARLDDGEPINVEEVFPGQQAA
jgi:hypothetical protein